MAHNLSHIIVHCLLPLENLPDFELHSDSVVLMQLSPFAPYALCFLHSKEPLLKSSFLFLDSNVKFDLLFLNALDSLILSSLYPSFEYFVSPPCVDVVFTVLRVLVFNCHNFVAKVVQSLFIIVSY